MIDSATLTYMPFTDRRKSQGSGFEAGQSGKLLVVTGASGKKYIIKHCHPHNAANEYVACWLAKRLGGSCPQRISAFSKQGLPKQICSCH